MPLDVDVDWRVGVRSRENRSGMGFEIHSKVH